MKAFKIRYVFKNEEKNEIIKIIYNIKEIERGNAESTINQLMNEGYKLISRDLYINLKDKNNKEVFEGDVVKAKGIYFNTRGEEIGIIRRTSLFIFLQNFSGYSDEYLANYSELEIIGTEFENPELIEK